MRKLKYKDVLNEEFKILKCPFCEKALKETFQPLLNKDKVLKDRKSVV